MWTVIANVIFGAILACYYFYVGGDREQVLAGAVLAGVSYLAGMFLGGMVCTPKIKRRISGKISEPLPDFDNIGD
jgi:hypothetical protein